MTLTNQFRNDCFLHDSGTSTPTMKITHLVVTARASDPLETDTLATDGSEWDRIGVSLTHSNKKTIVTASITPDKAVCATFEIVSQPALNQLLLNNATLLNVDYLIEVEEIGGFKNNVVISKVGNTITLKNNVSLNLSTQKVVHKMIARYAWVYDGQSEPGTGKVRKWFKASKFKNLNTNTFPIPYNFDTIG